MSIAEFNAKLYSIRKKIGLVARAVNMTSAGYNGKTKKEGHKMNKIKIAGAILLLAAGMAQAAIWTSATTDWNSTNAWDTGNVPNGYGEWAQINSATHPNLGGQTITLGQSSGYSLQTTGAGNRIFSNGALNFSRNLGDAFANDLHIASTGTASFQVPINFTRSASDTIATRIRLHGNASQVTFVEPITWSNSQLQFYNVSTTVNRMILVKKTVTGSTPGRNLWASAASANSRITFQGAIQATTNNINFQIGAGSGRIIFDNATGAVADASLSGLYLAGNLQVNRDDMIDTDLFLNGTGGYWNLSGHNNKITGALTVSGTADDTWTIDFGNAAGEALWFADSSGKTWNSSDTLDLDGFVFGTDELRFGTDANGLTAAQLGMITVDGSSVSGLSLDNSGYLIPEPSTVGLIGLSAVMAFFLRRIRM